MNPSPAYPMPLPPSVPARRLAHFLPAGAPLPPLSGTLPAAQRSRRATGRITSIGVKSGPRLYSFPLRPPRCNPAGATPAGQKTGGLQVVGKELAARVGSTETIVLPGPDTRLRAKTLARRRIRIALPVIPVHPGDFRGYIPKTRIGVSELMNTLMDCALFPGTDPPVPTCAARAPVYCPSPSTRLPYRV